MLLSRRTFALMPLALAAQGVRPGLIWVWFQSDELPPGVRGESVVFPRCYVADGRTHEARRATETGMFSHASTPSDPTLKSPLKEAGISYSEVILESGQNAVSVLAGAHNSSIVVFTRPATMERPAEKSIHVPLAIWYPKVLKTRVADNLLVSQVDLLLVPSLRDEMLTISNNTGHPSLTLRAGFVQVSQARSDWAPDPKNPLPKFSPPRRVPHGITLIGRLFEEGALGRVGIALERAFAVAAERPPSF